MQSRKKIFGKMRSFVIGILVGSIVLSVSGLTIAQEKPFSGKKITVAVLASGPKGPISAPLYYWRDKWEERTGAKLEIAEVPFGEMHEKIMTDLITGAGVYDGFITFSGWYGDYIAGDYIIPIEKYYDDPRFPKWSKETVIPALRDKHTWKDIWYGVPNDSDAQIFYYVRSALTNPTYQAQFKEKYGYDLPVPPRTWQEVRDVAEFFNGWDWNGDGEPEYGIVAPLKVGEQAVHHFLSMAASFSVLPGPKIDKYHNTYYFDPETMEPLINQSGNIKALETMIELLKFGPPGMKTWSLGAGFDFFVRGKAALTWSWGDIGSLAQEEKSKIKGDCGCAPMPGSMYIWDREHQKSVHKYNFAGNTVGGSWHGVISRLSENPEVVYDLYAFQASKPINMWNMMTGYTGIDFGRTFHFLPPYGPASLDEFIKFGWDATDIQEYGEAYYENYTAPTMFEYLRILGTDEYWSILDIHLSEAYVGRETPKEALDRVYDEWVKTTKSLGKAQQLKLYQESIGYKK